LQVKGIEVRTYCKQVYEPNRQSQAWKEVHKEAETHQI
jgi:hypothetical protein